MILGLRTLASIRWIPTIHSTITTPRNTSTPASPETKATITIGTDDMIDPKIGIRLIMPATIDRISWYFTPKIVRPMNVSHALITQITSRTDDMIDPKIGIRLIMPATIDRISWYFTPKIVRPMNVRHALITQITR